MKANQGKKIVLELVNGRVVSGTILTVDQQFVRVGTDEGVGTIPVDAIQIVWETLKRSVTDENMESIAEKLRDSVKAQIACTGFQFTCRQQYICRPPDNCSFSFACPGSYVPGFPSGGGGCPTFFCRPFQFGQPCGPFQFGQPCGPFQFGQPCVPFPFQPPCGPFQFGGSQCGTPGGFICAGQQFFGLVGPPGTPPGSQCGTPGGFICPGLQFAGAPVMPPGTTATAQNPPLPHVPALAGSKDDSQYRGHRQDEGRF